MTFDAVGLALLIFILRVLNNGMGTIRVIIMTHGQRNTAFVLAFFESLIFAFTVSQVVTDFDNVLNLGAYSLGFAVGGYVGMWIEDRYVTGYMTVNIIAPQKGVEIAQALRERGYGVTATTGEGAQGEVTMLRCVVLRRQVSDVHDTAQRLNPNVFVTIEEARAVHRGWMNTKIMKQQ